MWENADQNNSEYGHVLRSDYVFRELHVCNALRSLVFHNAQGTYPSLWFTDFWKNIGKFQLFSMCTSQDIVKASLHQSLFKLRCF